MNDVERVFKIIADVYRRYLREGVFEDPEGNFEIDVEKTLKENGIDVGEVFWDEALFIDFSINNEDYVATLDIDDGTVEIWKKIFEETID